jgi:FkbM family methyltransferase
MVVSRRVSFIGRHSKDKRPPWSPESRPVEIVPAAATGSESTIAHLTASPNPVPDGEGFGEAVIEWSTGDDSSGEVTVSFAGGPEQVFAVGPVGEQVAQWIGRGQYDFRLYRRDARADGPLGTVNVTRANAGSTISKSQDRDRRDNAHLSLLAAFALSAKDNCIDIGCHRGAFLHETLRCAPEGDHIAYEPIPELYALLQRKFPMVDVRDVALSNSPGQREFIHVRNLPGYSGFRERHYPEAPDIEPIRVRVERLDDSLPDGYVPKLVKIDVEGAELEVLEGARETIKRHRPLVIFEHGRGAADRYGTKPEQLFDLLTECGLRIFDIEGRGPLSRDEFVGSYEAGAVWNYVAHD